MITNPNTLGIFETHIAEIAEMVHAVGGLVYLDGANMNAILGITRPGRLRRRPDALQPAQDLQRPPRRRRSRGGSHRGGREACALPAFAHRRPAVRPAIVWPTIAPSRSAACGASSATSACWCGCIATSARHGPDGLRKISENAVLNANYLLSRVKHILPVPQGDRCMHEFVASAARIKAERDISAMDIAKRLLDYGFHAPTVYFPLIVKEAIMIEPTETESKATLDAFAETLECIIRETREQLHDAPSSTPVSRPDEVQAARQPKLTWKPQA